MPARTTDSAAVAEVNVSDLLTARQRRHFLLQRLLLRHSVGTGTDHATLRRRTAMQPWPDLRELLHGIPWALVGDIATRAYMPERMTKDMDVLVRRDDGPEAVARLVGAGFTLVGDLAMLGQADDHRIHEVRTIVGRHSPDDLEDLASLIFLGQQEMRESGDR